MSTHNAPEVLDLSAPIHSPIKLDSLATALGSIVVQFATTIDAPLLSISGENGSIDLAISGGRIDGSITIGDQHRHIDAEDTLGIDDGSIHTLGLTANETGLHLYVDGYEAFSTTPVGWLAELDQPRIVLDPQGVTDVQRLRVFPEPETNQMMVAHAVAASPFVEFAAAELSTRDAKRCGELTRGSIRARFRCRGIGQGGTIIGASGERGRLELCVEEGDLVFRVFESNTLIAEVTGNGHYDDGDWHDVVLTSGRGALILYVDGFQIGLAPGAAFFADIAPLTRVTVGMDLENSRLFGEAQTAAIYDTVLSDAQVKRLAGVAPLETRALFDTGFHGSISYRIPSLLRLNSGVILAGADRRVSIANDSPNDIDFVMRRSLDDGETWEEMQTLIEYPGEGREGASVIDSVLVQDEASGKVLVVIDHFPGGIGQPNCATGTGYDDNGRMILHNRAGEEFLLQSDGSVTTIAGDATDYVVSQSGDVTANGQPGGNIYLAYGVDTNETLFTHRTSYLQMITSDDDGETFSAPIDITSQVKLPWMRFFGTSPGNGIQLKKGKFAGRILVPVYYNHEEGRTFSCAVIYTDDAGEHWTLSDSPNDGRELFGETLTSRRLTDDRGSLHESVLVEDSTGAVHVFMRNQHPSGRVGHAISYDGGQTWEDMEYAEQLTEIFSQPNAIAVDVDGEPGIVFANASQMLPFRGCGVLRLSLDDGKTWPHNRVFNPRHYVYQCMTQLANGDIGLLWERETQGLYFTRVPLRWLTASQNTMS
ncbi:exo-alpha-sialidase [Corynebacterium choanae]|uniref:exo-alpha-sialidase n=1 Tax=Corynebacterium choanae TaxID=1862358 RepID=A0A3G6J6Q6_9CORY|nr:sialidase family protein [Corynebacterium choanae]AZA13443.1 Sialidase A precursor [Corynebacterium choanae]